MLTTPKEAAAQMGISTATITRCVKRGAPVHRWGSTGRCYRIDIPEFVEWMERQGKEEEKPSKIIKQNVQSMAMARRLHVMQLGT